MNINSSFTGYDAVMQLASKGISIRTISKDLNIPKSTVQNVISKHKKFGTTKRLPGSGRSPLINTDIKDAINNIREKEPTISASKRSQKLRETTDFEDTAQTIRNYLNSIGIYAFTASRKPLTNKKTK